MPTSPARPDSLVDSSADPRSKQSFGARILGFITTGRQRKADAEILGYARTYGSLNSGTFLLELERRFVGQ